MVDQFQPSAVIDELPIWVTDLVLSTHQHDFMYNYCANSLYSPKQVSDLRDGGSSRRMAAYLTNDNLSTVPLTEVFQDFASSVGYSSEINEAYINYYDSTTVSGIHIDSYASGLTMLYYPNLSWDLDWGGETLFFDKNKEIGFATIYKPNRAVFFDQRILHTARPPTVLTRSARFTIAYKGKNK